jgi:hypothetical protein
MRAKLSKGDGWLEIDERTDVIVSLAGCQFFAVEVTKNPQAWKHVIVNLHNALQGAMVCHLSGTAQVGALNDSSLRKISEWHERDRRGEIQRVKVRDDEWGSHYRPKTPHDAYPKTWLADAVTLFKRLHMSDQRIEQAGTLLTLSKTHSKSFQRLHELRKEFAHFTPKGWSIQLAGVPDICLDILEVIEMIADDGWPFRHLEDDQRSELIKLIGSLRVKLAHLRQGYLG